MNNVDAPLVRHDQDAGLKAAKELEEKAAKDLQYGVGTYVSREIKPQCVVDLPLAEKAHDFFMKLAWDYFPNDTAYHQTDEQRRINALAGQLAGDCERYTDFLERDDRDFNFLDVREKLDNYLLILAEILPAEVGQTDVVKNVIQGLARDTARVMNVQLEKEIEAKPFEGKKKGFSSSSEKAPESLSVVEEKALSEALVKYIEAKRPDVYTKLVIYLNSPAHEVSISDLLTQEDMDDFFHSVQGRETRLVEIDDKRIDLRISRRIQWMFTHDGDVVQSDLLSAVSKVNRVGSPTFFAEQVGRSTATVKSATQLKDLLGRRRVETPEMKSVNQVADMLGAQMAASDLREKLLAHEKEVQDKIANKDYDRSVLVQKAQSLMIDIVKVAPQYEADLQRKYSELTNEGKYGADYWKKQDAVKKFGELKGIEAEVASWLNSIIHAPENRLLSECNRALAFIEIRLNKIHTAEGWYVNSNNTVLSAIARARDEITVWRDAFQKAQDEAEQRKEQHLQERQEQGLGSAMESFSAAIAAKRARPNQEALTAETSSTAPTDGEIPATQTTSAEEPVSLDDLLKGQGGGQLTQSQGSTT